jgi:HK97 family phage prohead protease
MKIQRCEFRSKIEMGEAENRQYFQGLVCPYSSWSYPIYDYMKEQFLPGAFTSSLQDPENNIIATVDHDPGKLLATTKAGTLKLEDRGDGLYMTCEKRNTSWANDLYEMIKSGDITGMSFGFRAQTESYGRVDGMSTRTISKAEIKEVSFVFNPQYPDSEAEVRSRAEAEATELATLLKYLKVIACR